MIQKRLSPQRHLLSESDNFICRDITREEEPHVDGSSVATLLPVVPPSQHVILPYTRRAFGVELIMPFCHCYHLELPVQYLPRVHQYISSHDRIFTVFHASPHTTSPNWVKARTDDT